MTIRATPAEVASATAARQAALDASKEANSLASPDGHEAAAVAHDDAARAAGVIATQSNGYDKMLWQSIVAAHRSSGEIHRARLSDVPSTFAVYCALWHHAAAEGIYVSYQGVDTNVLGFFHPREALRQGAGWPQIYVTRQHYYPLHDQPSDQKRPDVPDAGPIDILEELFTLAHEYGHYVSLLANGRSTEYVDAVTHIGQCVDSAIAPTITERAQALVHDEETRAWTYGREALVSFGFGDMAGFDARAKRSLDRYEEIFRGEILSKQVE